MRPPLFLLALPVSFPWVLTATPTLCAGAVSTASPPPPTPAPAPAPGGDVPGKLVPRPRVQGDTPDVPEVIGAHKVHLPAQQPQEAKVQLPQHQPNTYVLGESCCSGLWSVYLPVVCTNEE